MPWQQLQASGTKSGGFDIATPAQVPLNHHLDTDEVWSARSSADYLTAIGDDKVEDHELPEMDYEGKIREIIIPVQYSGLDAQGYVQMSYGVFVNDILITPIKSYHGATIGQAFVDKQIHYYEDEIQSTWPGINGELWNFYKRLDPTSVFYRILIESVPFQPPDPDEPDLPGGVPE